MLTSSLISLPLHIQKPNILSNHDDDGGTFFINR